MSELRIDRLSAHATGWPEPGQVPQMLRHVAEDRLGGALREHPLPDGEWCVRRLDVAVELDPERPLSALETDWADRIVTALRLSLRDGSQDVVRFVRPEAAVDDLLCGLAASRHEHAWAWRQVGLLEAGDPDPQSDPGEVCLRVLNRLPHGRVAAAARWVARAGVPAVHRLLGSAGWVRVAALVALEAGATWTPPDQATEATPDASGRPPADRRTQAALSRAIVTTGALAPALRSSGLRVEPRTLQAWAVLAIGSADPALLRSGPEQLASLVAVVGVRLQPTAAPGLAAPASGRQAPPGPARGRPSDPGVAALSRAGDRHAPHAEPDEPRRPRPEPGRPPESGAEASARGAGSPDSPAEDLSEGVTTSWGGLLYLLNSAADAGLPDVLGEPPFLSRPAPWVMHRIGLALVPAEADDPALRAFAGVPAWEPQKPPDDAEQRAIDACAARWAAVTAKRLRPDPGEETDAELVQRIARRAATIAQEPGWVEVRLRLGDVDLDVRRAGLDVDPGWVWWLGHVVRFRYE